MTAICLLILVYLIRGKEINSLLEKVKNVDWHAKSNQLYTQIKPYAFKYGRVAARPLLQFLYVLKDKDTTTTERAMIYAALIYTISPINILPKAIYGLLGILDEGAAIMFVYNKIKAKITPEINARVDMTLDNWFGVNCQFVETDF